MFKLNRKTEYGLLALQYMARMENNEVATVKEITSQHRIPQSLLAKILQGLARKKIIQSVKGARGGYVMAEPWGRTSAVP
jgi:Rrf2 family protein